MIYEVQSDNRKEHLLTFYVDWKLQNQTRRDEQTLALDSIARSGLLKWWCR